MFASTMLLEQALNPNLFQFGSRRLEVLAQYASKLDCLRWHIPVVTVTGTNGKGSTVTALSLFIRQQVYGRRLYITSFIFLS